MYQFISVIDAHAAGEPLRLITNGPNLIGTSLFEKQEYMKKNFDYIRTTTMLEPRGHNDMFGAFLTEPIDPRADFGIIFFDGGCYYGMCGHGSLAVATIALKTGLLPVQEPCTTVTLETVSGLVKIYVETGEEGHQWATLEGIPSFVYKTDVTITVFEQTITVDIVFSGNFFAVIDVDQLGLKHSCEYIEQFKKYGLEIRNQLNNIIQICHPKIPHLGRITDILFTGSPDTKDSAFKSLVFLGRAQFDRSPCGTGTAAKMTLLHSKGLLKVGELFSHKSIIGTVFEGKIDSLTTVDKYQAIVPHIKGRAFITGFNKLVIESDDILKYGFFL
ncbi:MAG: proline racemase family protein [Bacillota bacterium]